MKKCVLINLSVLLLVVAVIFVSRADLHAAVGDPVPGAEIYIEQEPYHGQKAKAKVDNRGNFEFNDINGLEGGKYSLYIRFPLTKNLKKELAEKKLLHLHFEIGKTRNKGKEIIVSKTILIKTSKLLKGKKIKVFSFKLKEDILFWRKPFSNKTQTNKSGFAVGGFSQS
ncbi:carboxypeptidase-like regulatory domain-containing protein [Acidobacteriota bacterium]